MSAATSAERSAGRRIADSVLDAVAAPLSFVDQSTSYSRHLEQRLLAEGKRRLIECLNRELATDLHEHYRSAHRAIVTGFSQMESAYRRWRDDYVTRTLKRLDDASTQDGSAPVETGPYRMWASRFVQCHQTLLDLDSRKDTDSQREAVLAEIVHEVPPCLAAFERLRERVEGLVAPSGRSEARKALVKHYARVFVGRCLSLWQGALIDLREIELPGLARAPDSPTRQRSPDALRFGSDMPLDRQEKLDLDRLDGIFKAWKVGAFAPTERGLLDAGMLDAMKPHRERYKKIPPSAPDAPLADHELVFRLLFPGQPWRNPQSPTDARPPVELEQLRRIRAAATETFRAFDECDDMSPWSLGRLKWIDRPMLQRIFTVIVERCPEPVALTELHALVLRNLPSGRHFTEGERSYVLYHLQTVVAGFSQVIAAYHRAYRETLAKAGENDGETSNASGWDRTEGKDFGWSRLWPTVWSEGSAALWTDREPMQGAVPLPVTYRLIFVRKRDSDIVDSVMLVPLFPVKRTLEARPLREFMEYMHSGMVAVLPGDNQIARHPYRIAAALGQTVRLTRSIGRVFRLGIHLLWDRIRFGRLHDPHSPTEAGAGQHTTPAPTPGERRIVIWNRSIRDLVHLGSQRHGPVDQLRAFGLRQLPRVLPELARCEDTVDRLDDWSAFGRRDKRLRLMLEPVPHLMWCDTLRLIAAEWRGLRGEEIGGLVRAAARAAGPVPLSEEALAEAVADMGDEAMTRLEASLASGQDPLELEHRRTPKPPPAPSPTATGTAAEGDRDGQTTRERLASGLYGHYSDHRFDLARRNARLVAELLGQLFGHFVSGIEHDPEQDARPRLAASLLEMFLLVSLYYQSSRPDPTAAAPLRLAGRTFGVDIFGITARAHLGGSRGHEMRVRVLASLIVAPLRLTRHEIRAWAADSAWAESTLDAWARDVERRWTITLGGLEDRLRDGLASTVARGEQSIQEAYADEVEPPSVRAILPEALRRSEPSTYNTLRDLFWDYMHWPLAGRRGGDR